MDGRINKIALSLLKGIGPIKAKTLVAYAGDLSSIFSTSDQELSDLSGLSVSKVKKLDRAAALTRAKEEITFIDENGINLHYYQDSNYPTALKFCEDSPLVLYSKGNFEFKSECIAVVGTRKATSYGKKITHDLIKDLSGQDIQIVSGLAHGIDKEAHEAALTNNIPTLAVLGHGLDLIYPAANKGLAKRMLKNGGIITEFISKTPGDPSNFPQRNRIVAGLCQATVVIESAITGGSLITAGLAFDYSRQVFAFPGGIDRTYSAGCNALIKQNKASLITSAEDLITEMGWEEIEEKQEPVQSDLFDALTVEEEKLLRVMTSEKKAHVDVLAERTSLNSSDLSVHLFNLEMRGIIEALPGNFYRVEA